MYKLLIVDDEHHVVDWLYRLFTGLDEPEFVVYRAYSGYQALDLLERTRIDIILTDINMPGITGVELIETVLCSWPYCKVIFITGYNEFEYAYKAIKYEAVDYLLKTEDDENIINAVKKTVLKIEIGLRDSHLLEKAKEQEGMLKYLIRMKVLSDFKNRNGKSAVSSSDEIRYNEIGFNMDNPVLLIYIRLDELPMNPVSYEYLRTLYSINLIFEKFVPGYSCCVLDIGTFEALAVIQSENSINVSGKDDASVKRKSLTFIGEMLETVQASCASALRTTVSMILNGNFVEWGRIIDTAGNMRSYLQRISGLKKGVLIKNAEFPQVAERSIDDDKVHLKKTLPQKESLNVLSFYLRRGQKSEFMKILDGITSVMLQTSNMNNIYLTEIYLSIAVIFFSYFEETGDCRFPDGIDLRRFLSINDFGNWEEAVCCIRRTAEEIFSRQSEFEKQSDEEMLRKIKEYVFENISKDFALADIAEHMFYNPSYLSRIFRQTTGMKLFDWITGIRMEKVKELLVSQVLSVNEICTLVGFKNSQHFATVFKKNIGMSPSEYRESRK